MGGLRKYMPITFATMITGWLAICGIPFFAGFFSKDEILWKTWSAGGLSIPSPAFSKILWGIGALTALLTAVYMTRMMVMTFWGTERFREAHHSSGEKTDEHSSHGLHQPHESPWVMTVPLIVLAVLSTIGGFIGVPYALSSLVTEKDLNYIEHTLEPVTARSSAETQATHNESVPPSTHEGEGVVVTPPTQPSSPAPVHAIHTAEEITHERLLALVSVAIAALGIGIGWTVFKKRPLLQMPRIMENKYYVDEIYDMVLIRPIEVGSREGLWKIFDVGVIDGLLHSIGEAVTEAGRLGRYLQAGFVRGYAAIILTGALILIGLFVYYSTA